MFADGRLVLLSHKAGVELEQLQSSFQASPCVQTTYGGLQCDPALRVTVRMRYNVDSNLGHRVTWRPTLTSMNIVKALFLTRLFNCLHMDEETVFQVTSQSHLRISTRIDLNA